MFLNIRNPYIFEGNGQKWDRLEQHIVIADRKNNILQEGFKNYDEAHEFFVKNYIGEELNYAVNKIYEREDELAEALYNDAEISKKVEELKLIAEDEGDDDFSEDTAKEEIVEEELAKRRTTEEQALLDKHSEILRKYRVDSYYKTTDEIVQEVAHGEHGTAPNGEQYDGVLFTNIHDAMDVMSYGIVNSQEELLGDVIVPLKHVDIKSAEIYKQTVRSTNDFTLTPEARQQMEEVRKQYEGTSQWLKAPNGKATNLTVHQWLAVRTENFKRWFGDWEAVQIVQKVKDFLKRSQAVGSITGNEFQKDNTPLVDRVIDYYRKTGNTVVTNEELGERSFCACT